MNPMRMNSDMQRIPTMTMNSNIVMLHIELIDAIVTATQHLIQHTCAQKNDKLNYCLCNAIRGHTRMQAYSHHTCMHGNDAKDPYVRQHGEPPKTSCQSL